MQFEYNEAFSRNLGLVTPEEQEILRFKKAAIAGMGGVGGVHLQTLVRMGIQNFHIADMDEFELGNFNRQAGAFMSTIGKPKAETMRKIALDINPECKITVFADGVNESNIDEFLDGVDVYLDGLDFFVPEVREQVFARCHEKGIPAVTAGPVGATTAYLVFDPNGISFEEYFQFKESDNIQKAVRFLVGLSPRLAHRNHIVDKRYFDFKRKKSGSLAVACQAASAVACAEVLKLLLDRGKTYYLPWTMQFDMLNNRYHRVYNWLGNRNPLNILKIKILYKMLNKDIPAMPKPPVQSDIKAVLDTAKWAPSGDNAQPWFITLKSESEFSMDLTRFKQNTYNLLPMPDLISTGMFIESARIAAAQKGYKLDWKMKGEETLTAQIKKSDDTPEHALYPYIKTRSVNRYPFKPKPLPQRVKEILDSTFDDDMQLFWYTSRKDRWTIAKLLMAVTDTRLRIPETYEIHSNMIDWSGQDSPDRMPYSALGGNPLTVAIMKGALSKESINAFMMKLPGSTLALQAELDMIPALLCSGHFVAAFDPKKTPEPSAQDYIRAGQAMQRFWLTLTQQHMVLQPWYIPVMFSRYVSEGIEFTKEQKFLDKAQLIHNRLEKTVLEPRSIKLEHVFFSGRVGYHIKNSKRRSVRKDLDALIVEDKSNPVERSRAGKA